MGPTISPGAVIQHLAKFRARMVEQGYSVPPPLTRGGSNNGIRAGRDRNTVTVGEPITARPSRRTTKRAAKKATPKEDSEENTDQETDQSSEEETFTKRPRKAKGKGKAKRPAYARRTAKEAQQLTDSDSDAVKEEPTSAAEGQYSQARYGVGDSMWDMDDINEAPPKRSSQSSQPSTKMVVLDIGRAGFARLGVSSQAEELESSDDDDPDRKSENDIARDHSLMDYTQDNGAGELRNANDLHNQISVDHRERADGGNLGFFQHDGFEGELVVPSSLPVYSPGNLNVVPKFDGKPSTLLYHTHDSSYGNKDRVSHYRATTSGFPALPNSSTIGKPDNQVSDYGGSYQSHFDASQQSAFHGYGYHGQNHPLLSGNDGLPGTSAGCASNEAMGHRPSVSQPRFASQASNVRGQQASYSSVDSYRPIGGEFADFPNVDLSSYSETPVAMSRDNSGFDQIASNRRPMTDAGIPWEAFLEPQDDGFGY